MPLLRPSPSAHRMFGVPAAGAPGYSSRRHAQQVSRPPKQVHRRAQKTEHRQRVSPAGNSGTFGLEERAPRFASSWSTPDLDTLGGPVSLHFYRPRKQSPADIVKALLEHPKLETTAVAHKGSRSVLIRVPAPKWREVERFLESIDGRGIR